MRDSNFETEVRREFSFLIEQGFALANSTAQNVEYAFGDYLLEIDYDIRSAQIGLFLHSKSDPNRGGASFGFVLAALGRNVNYSSPVNILTPDDITNRIRELGILFRENVPIDTFRSMFLWQEIRRLAEEHRNKSYPTITPVELSARFLMLWEQQRYIELVRMFETMEKHLSDEERGKLEMAKARLVGRPN